jgi:NDP-mannose synthase
MSTAVILCGGKGSRLYPYTVVMPKPMLPIGNMPIVEIISRQLNYYGFDDVVVSLGHNTHIIKHFLEGISGDPGLPKYRFVEESEPLGTAGPVGLLEEAPDNFLVMNGDILTNVALDEFFKFHLDKQAAFSICIRSTNYTLPFGSVEIDSDNNVKRFVEKPKIELLDNIGIYAYSQKALEYVKPNTQLYVNDLVQQLVEAGEKVCSYLDTSPYYWIDIGSHADYDKANFDLNNVISEFPYLKDIKS